MTASTLLSDSGGVSRLPKRAFASDSGGVVRGPAKRIFVSDSGGTARLVFANQVNASASPTLCFASGFGPITLTTNTTTVTATGGIPPYTYSWSLSGTSGPPITITNPTGATTAFSAHVGPGATALASGDCTVTDSIGNQGHASVVVDITTTN